MYVNGKNSYGPFSYSYGSKEAGVNNLVHMTACLAHFIGLCWRRSFRNPGLAS